MKFSHSIRFNAVPEWTSNYIAYSNLKKLIFTLEKEVNQGTQGVNSDGESSPLLGATRNDPDKIFSEALDRELEKIDTFYRGKEEEIFQEVGQVLKEGSNLDIENSTNAVDSDGQGLHRRKRSSSGGKRNRQNSLFGSWTLPGRRRQSISNLAMDTIDSGSSEDEATDRPASNYRRNTDDIKDIDGTEDDNNAEVVEDIESTENPDSPGGARKKRDSTGSAPLRRRISSGLDDTSDHAISIAYDSGAIIKKRMVSNYVALCELRSYIQLNKTGFSKVLKKYDKILDRKLKPKYLAENVAPAYPFQQETTDGLGDRISQLEQSYAVLNTQGNLEQAKRQLRLDLREHVVWERNTVWREMIGIERKAQAVNLGIRRTLLGSDNDSKPRKQGDDDRSDMQSITTPIGKYRCPRFLLTSTFYVLIIALAVFISLLFIPIMELPEQQNCLAMVVFVSILWATEAIPLFVTSLLVPFLVVILRVVRTDAEPHHRLETKAAATYVFSAMWTPVIMLLLGGFTLAAALSKHNIAKMMATFVLSKAGTRPRNVLLANMFVSMFVSMWISNVASPVLFFSIIQPILRNLPNDSSMTKALLLGIALACNIGGMASPIASPQNLIALENMNPQLGWGKWFFIALPVCVISILLIWVFLLIALRPGRDDNIVPIRPMKDKFSGTQWFITIVTIATIGLWCASHQLEPYLGDMGVIAIIPIALFFGTGVLTKEDFNNFLWTIIILAAGGLALGKAVSSSGLLYTMAASITEKVQGLSLYGVFIVFAALILVVASFVSHTVAALIVLPLVKQVGEGMDEPHPNLLVMGSVMMCTAAMALPTSGFPNMTAIMMEDSQTGKRYLRVQHFLVNGIPASIITFAVVISVGYGLMILTGL